MTKDEALDLALEALESLFNWKVDSERGQRCSEAITAIKKARSAPVQEPVAYFVNCTNCGEEKKIERGNHHPWCFCGSDSFDWANSRDLEPAAQRQWVGLTDKEIRNWWSSENGLEDCDICKIDDFVMVVKAIEAKLKEKNT
jgi:hypothetical protein